jgi:hypothetical protein
VGVHTRGGLGSVRFARAWTHTGPESALVMATPSHAFIGRLPNQGQAISADTLPMPGSAWVFRRGSESLIISRLTLTTCTLLVVIGRDGATRSRSFPDVESAILYSQQLESALVAGGWLLEEIVAPEGPDPAAMWPATLH